MDSAEECRERAAQCRRLAKAITTPNDPTAGELLKLATEWDIRAVAAEAAAKGEPKPDRPPNER